MKRKQTILAMLLKFVSSLAYAEKETLHVWMNDGSETALNTTMRKLLILFLLLLALPLQSEAQNNATLVLWHADGSTTDVELYTQPLVLFQNDSVYVTSPIADLRYAESEIQRFSYKGYGTGIVLPESEKNYKQEDGLLIFNGIKNVDNIVLYTNDGSRVPVLPNYKNGDICLPLNALPKGVYIISVNGKTSKIIKK